MSSDFWSIVESIGWGTETTDYEKVARMLYYSMTSEQAECFRREFENRKALLYEVCSASVVECISDDGLDDLFSHIIGLGEHEYNDVLSHPELANIRYAEDKYTESFAYCMPDMAVLRDGEVGRTENKQLDRWPGNIIIGRMKERDSE